MEAEPEEKATEIALGCSLIFLLLPFIILFKSFVMTQLWGWFVVPFGIMNIGLAHAYGISTLIYLMLPVPNSKDMEDKGIIQMLGRTIGVGFFFPLILWGIGAICHWFMV